MALFRARRPTAQTIYNWLDILRSEGWLDATGRPRREPPMQQYLLLVDTAGQKSIEQIRTALRQPDVLSLEPVAGIYDLLVRIKSRVAERADELGRACVAAGARDARTLTLKRSGGEKTDSATNLTSVHRRT